MYETVVDKYVRLISEKLTVEHINDLMKLDQEVAYEICERLKHAPLESDMSYGTFSYHVWKNNRGDLLPFVVDICCHLNIRHKLENEYPNAFFMQYIHIKNEDFLSFILDMRIISITSICKRFINDICILMNIELFSN